MKKTPTKLSWRIFHYGYAIVATKTGIGKQKIGTQEYGRGKDANFMVPFHSVSVVSVAAGWFDGNLSVHSCCVLPCYETSDLMRDCMQIRGLVGWIMFPRSILMTCCDIHVYCL
jgi:hypothetical protein